jgi:hypothetical protein
MVEITPQELRRLRSGSMDRGEFEMIRNRTQLRAEAAEWQATLASLELARQEALDEVERLRAALGDVKDLAQEDAPAHMIIDVCDRTLAACP